MLHFVPPGARDAQVEHHIREEAWNLSGCLPCTSQMEARRLLTTCLGLLGTEGTLVLLEALEFATGACPGSTSSSLPSITPTPGQ